MKASLAKNDVMINGDQLPSPNTERVWTREVMVCEEYIPPCCSAGVIFIVYAFRKKALHLVSWF